MPPDAPDLAILLDNFGSERADADFARDSNMNRESVFLETNEVHEYLKRDPHYSYVLGTMGSGKSILLLKKWDHIEQTATGAILAPRTAGRVFTPSASFATTVRYTGYWHIERDGEQNIDSWTQIWEWALLGCILRRWLEHPAQDGQASAAIRRELTVLLADQNLVEDPYDSIANCLEVPVERAAGQSVLPHPENLRRFVERNSNAFPPTFVFLDNQDDFFNDAPEFWTASALGCKYAIDQIHRRSNHRVHVFLTLRPEILWRTEMNADAMRHYGDVFRIEWSSDQLWDMFTKRAGRLRDDLLAVPPLRSVNALAAFFGDGFFRLSDPEAVRPVIANHAAGKDGPIKELLQRYLLRHTLGRPRELIVIGNAILDARRGASPGSRYGQEVVREAVAKAGQMIALAYIGEIKHRWPWHAEGEPAEESIRRFLRDFIESNVLSRSDAKHVEAVYLTTCVQSTPPRARRPFEILAAAGLIGWPESALNVTGKQRQHFPRPGSQRELRVPGTAKYYLVHPVLYGGEFGIQAKKGLVVGPDEPFDP